MNITKTPHLFAIATVVFFAGYASPAKASFLDLSHDPLFLDQSVPPAISVTLDDSGSMYWSYMGPSGSNGTDFTDPTLNTLYFDPNITYSPPLKADGSQMPDSNPTAAWVDGYPNNMNDTVDLTKDYITIRRVVYNRYDDNVRIGFVNTQQRGIGDVGALYQNYHPNAWGTAAYYSVRNAANTGWDTVYVTGDDLKNFANWYSYYNSRAKLSRAAISRSFSGFGPNFKIAWQELNRNTTFSPLEKFENTHRADFFNWLFKSPTSGGTPLRRAFYRAGQLFESDSSYWSADFNTNLSCQQNFHIAISDGGWNGSFSATVLMDEDGGALPGDTKSLYSNYTGTGEQAIYKKDESRTTLADIAFNSWAKDLNPNLNNNVKRFKKSFTKSDGTNIDLSGVSDAWQSEEFVWNPKNDPAYWQHLVTYNVGMGLESTRVQNYENNNFASPNCPSQAAVADAKEAVYLGLRKGQCNWPDASNENVRIDDVWHSSVNSRGDFFSANNPTELVKALNNVVNNILERVSRGSSSTVSSGVITSTTRVYTPGFDSSTWSGSLIAREINADKSLGDPVWDAACILTGGLCAATGENVTKQAIRKVFTYDPENESKERFDATLKTSLKGLIGTNAQAMITNLGVTVDEIIEYAVGEQSEEQSNSGVLKDRVSVLADVVHSSPYIVRGPSASYSDSQWLPGTAERAAADADNGYLQFQITQKDRNNTVYIGSNGGMLHAFNAEGADEGKERWAYMPSKALNNIHRLPDPTATHWSYVDNTPVVRDAFFNDAWRSVMVSGMRYGGQSFFALDVTDGNSTEPTVLWEFSDADDPDMGYSYGQATIVRITSTGEWVALLPNGYNNSQPDYANPLDPRNQVSFSGNAVLFVVRLRDGQLLTKIDTGVGDALTPNGLADVVTVDSEFVTPPGASQPMVDYGVDYGYAGDLYGNLWRFDFTDTDYSKWSATKLVAANGIKERPITVKPQVVAVPDSVKSKENDVIVMYATGKYLEPSDRSINLPAKQYIVGVIDGLASTEVNLDISSSGFIEQTFSSAGSGYLRDITANDVDHANDNGWKVELPENGERVFNPLTKIQTQLLFVTSNVTAGTDPCEAGGRSWLMAINPLTGGEPTLGQIFKNIEIIINGVPVRIIDDGAAVVIQDFIVGKINLTEDRDTLYANLDGVNDTFTVDFQKFTWRRRNWTNLLTE